MSKVIAVFGAGTGLGVSVARRFGREGYRVALVARRAEQLTALVTTLGAEGIDPAGIPTVNPAYLADLLWEMSTKRDRFEEYHPRP